MRTISGGGRYERNGQEIRRAHARIRIKRRRGTLQQDAQGILCPAARDTRLAGTFFQRVRLLGAAGRRRRRVRGDLYDRLADQRSKFTLYAVLSNRSRYDFESLARARENLFDEYFDLDLLRCTPDEVFVDLGAYVGDSVASYLLNYGAECYKRIYCYEITPEVFAALERTLRDIPRVSLRQKGVSDRPGVMRLNVCKTSSSANTLGSEGVCDVEVTTLDADIPEPVTLIKADIEGSERQALKGAENHIKNERPKLLISVYHGNEDLTAVPHLIDSIRSDYAFYLRSKGTPLHPTELTLFAL